MTGFNMPPGCNVNYIPGNRPEDVEQDVLMTEFYASLSEDELNLMNALTNEGFMRSIRIDLEKVLWKAIEFGRRIDNQKDQPKDYKDYEAPTCCCCTGYDTEGNIVKVPEARLLYKCERPGCHCYTCGEHKQTCGYCLGCCVEVHEDFNHSIKAEGELSVS